MLPHNTLVVVADGHCATLFRNTSKHGIELTETERVTPETFNRPKPGDANPDVILTDEEPERFAAQLADHLNDMVLKHKVEDIAIIADPSTLGVLRKSYHKELQFRLKKEVAKNLVNSHLQAIEDALS